MEVDIQELSKEVLKRCSRNDESEFMKKFVQT